MNAELHSITNALKPVIEGCCTEAVEVSQKIEGGRLDVVVKPGGADIAVLVGKNGRTVRGMQMVVANAGRMVGLDAKLQLVEPLGLKSKSSGIRRGNFEMQEFLRLMNGIAILLFDPMPSMSVSRPTVGADEQHSKVVVRFNIPPIDHERVTSVIGLNEIFWVWGIKHGQRIAIDIQAEQ